LGTALGLLFADRQIEASLAHGDPNIGKVLGISQAEAEHCLGRHDNWYEEYEEADRRFDRIDGPPTPWERRPKVMRGSSSPMAIMNRVPAGCPCARPATTP